MARIHVRNVHIRRLLYLSAHTAVEPHQQGDEFRPGDFSVTLEQFLQLPAFEGSHIVQGQYGLEQRILRTEIPEWIFHILSLRHTQQDINHLGSLPSCERSIGSDAAFLVGKEVGRMICSFWPVYPRA